MSDASILDNWQKVKETALEACAVPVRGYALAAIGEDGSWYWGANYGMPAEQCLEMARKLREMAAHATQHAKGGTQ